MSAVAVRPSACLRLSQRAPVSSLPPLYAQSHRVHAPTSSPTTSTHPTHAYTASQVAILRHPFDRDRPVCVGQSSVWDTLTPPSPTCFGTLGGYRPDRKTSSPRRYAVGSVRAVSLR